VSTAADREAVRVTLREARIQVSEASQALRLSTERLRAERDGLRDRFAAAALQGLLASPHLPEWSWTPWAHDKPETVAAVAYALADAMLKEREAAK